MKLRREMSFLPTSESYQAEGQSSQFNKVPVTYLLTLLDVYRALLAGEG